MTALEKLRRAIDAMHSINDDPHELFVWTTDIDGRTRSLFAALPDNDYGQPDDDADPEPLTLFDLRAALDEIKELEKREPLPFVQAYNTPEEHYMAILTQWLADCEQLAYYKAKEKENRLILFGATFPNPAEGTQRHKLPDGRSVKGEYKINRKLDEAALPTTLQALREEGVGNTDALVRYKAELAKKEWNTLSDHAKLLFSSAVIATPGTPILKVEAPKQGR